MTEALWVSYWQSKHIHLSPKETHTSLQEQIGLGLPYISSPAEQNLIEASAPVLKVDFNAADKVCTMQVMITFTPSVLWDSS